MCNRSSPSMLPVGRQFFLSRAWEEYPPGWLPFPKEQYYVCIIFISRAKSLNQKQKRTFARRIPLLLLYVVLFVTSVYAQAGTGSYNYWKKAEEQHKSQLLGMAVQKLNNTYRKVTAKQFSKRGKKNPKPTNNHQISLSFKKTWNNKTPGWILSSSYTTLLSICHKIAKVSSCMDSPSTPFLSAVDHKNCLHCTKNDLF